MIILFLTFYFNSYCLYNGLYQVSLDDSLFYLNTRRHGEVTFYSITGDGTENITIIGTATSNQLFDVGGVLAKNDDDNNDNKKNNEDDDSSIVSSTGFIVGIIIAAVVVSGLIFAGIWYVIRSKPNQHSAPLMDPNRA